VPLVGCLLALSVWPAAITDRSFTAGTQTAAGWTGYAPLARSDK
jgi:hypothetical protein